MSEPGSPTLADAPDEGTDDGVPTASPLRSWLDPAGLRAATLLALVAALANGIWILLDHTPPSWDQAHYLDATWHYQQAHAIDGLAGLVQSIHSTDPGHGPLFTVALLPFFYVLDDLTRSGLILNLMLAPVLYLSAGQIAMHLFRSWQARLLTILLVATMPLMVGLFHNNLQDFPLATFTALSLLLLLKSELFQRRAISLLLGLTLGLGTLTKVTFPMFVAGPLLLVLGYIAFSAWRDRDGDDRAARIDLRAVAINLAAAAIVYLALVLPWYLSNLSATVDYVKSTTSGPLAEGVGSSDPYALDAFFTFTVGVVNSQVSWIIGLAALVAILLNLGRLRAWVTPPVKSQQLLAAAFLIAWVLPPFLSIAFGQNQDPRLMASAMPGMAIITAAAIAGIEIVRLRLALVCVTAVALLYQSVNHVTSVRPGFMPQEIRVDLGPTAAVLPLDSRPIGYEQLPGKDYATPIVRHIESVARSRGGNGEIPPSTICLLQSDPVVNLNTFGFLAHSRNDPFSILEPQIGPDGRTGLTNILAGCDFAVYARPPGPTPGTDEDRIAIVNEKVAAQFMTPRMFALFAGPSMRFPVSKSATSGDPTEDLNGPSSDWVRVLVRE